jgi:nucleoside-diphosphate-sugar epimerase
VTSSASIQRIALTGASGLLGRAIIKQLADRKDVSLLTLHRSDTAPAGFGNIRHVITDLSDAPKIDSLLQQFEPTLFIHAAATGMQRPRPDAATLAGVNVGLPVQLAETVGSLNDCSFLHISSGLAYRDQGRPLREDDPLDTTHPYGASKAQAEKELKTLALKSRIRLMIVRPFSFTGEGDVGTRLFPSLLHHASRGIPFEMSEGDQIRDHSSVDDIASGVVAAAGLTTQAKPVSVYNLGSGDTRTLRNLVEDVIEQLQLEVDVRFGACPHGPDELMFMIPDLTHVQETLGWRAHENIAHAVWRLARSSFPALKLTEPCREV